MRAYGGSAIKTLGCARDDDTGERIGQTWYEREMKERWKYERKRGAFVLLARESERR